MPRPNQDRTAQVIGMVTPEEKQAVKAQAERLHMTVSDYVRLVIMHEVTGQWISVSSSEDSDNADAIK